MSESHDYEVVFHSQARADLDNAYQHAARHAPGTASRWVDRFQEALNTLSRDPQRCPLAPETRFVDEDIHEFHFGRRPNVFRVFFFIDEPYVRILRIRRASTRGLTHRDIEHALDDD